MSVYGFDPDNGGAIGRFLRWAFGRSWRTTVLGLLSLTSTAVAAVSASQDVPSYLVRWAPVVAQMLTSVGLMITKDARVTGNDRIIGDESVPNALPPSARAQPSETSPAPSATPTKGDAS